MRSILVFVVGALLAFGEDRCCHPSEGCSEVVCMTDVNCIGSEDACTKRCSGVWCPGSGPSPPSPTPTPTPTPSPPSPPTPPPTPSPSPSDCPGGTYDACTNLCPTDDQTVHDACVRSCATRCPDAPAPTPTPTPPPPTPVPTPTPSPSPFDCPGGSYDACTNMCPTDDQRVYDSCVRSCAKRCPDAPSPTPTPPPTTTPAPTPSPSPSPSDCPGGSYDACAAMCPTDDKIVHDACVASCARRCPDAPAPTPPPMPTPTPTTTTTPTPPTTSPAPELCPGGSLNNCIDECPQDATAFKACVEICQKRCSSIEDISV